MEPSLLIVASAAADQRFVASLGETGFAVQCAAGLSDGVRSVIAEPPSAVVIVADSANAREHCAVFRALGDVPIVVAGEGLTSEVIAACLDAGADTALRLPMAADEAVARVRVVLRRTEQQWAHNAPRKIVAGNLAIDLDTRAVTLRGREVALSPTEFGLLAALAESQGSVVTNRELLSRVWGPEYADDVHYVRLYIGYLRAKLEDDPQHPQLIVNQWGVGYRLVLPETASAHAPESRPSDAPERASIESRPMTEAVS
jgi:two-component system, OmpR family, KDP operon response regulator KdpE